MGTNYIREIVSGKKARFIDHETATNLDLVYVTDRILMGLRSTISMGWPATGLASYYRNRRRDVLRFITSRHGEKWWIWNLCPLYENAYAPESMHNRVSRYPFPDHHPPPLALLPLAVREMTAWLDGDSERVAIIHCKAGKGRSGTLLCSYMLSLPELPSPPQLDTSYSASELALRDTIPTKFGQSQVRDGWVVVGSGGAVAEIPVADDEREDSGPSTPEPFERIKVASRSSSMTTLSRTSTVSREVTVSAEPAYDPIDIGDEQAAGLDGQQDRADGVVDAVFKLHSSRRMKPTSTGRGVSIASQRRWVRYIHLLFNHLAPPSYLSATSERVRVVSITMYLTPPRTWQRPLAHVLVGADAGRGKAWASIARYDDEYVAELKERGGGGSGVGGSVTWGGVGGEGRFDAKKMFKSCGKMVSATPPDGVADEARVVHHLIPQTDDNQPLVLDRSREFRMKFHLGSLPLGWAWLIPAFHLREPTPPTTRTHTLQFPRSQLDFPLGPGQAVEEIVVRLEELPKDSFSTPARLLSEEEEAREGLDDTKGEHHLDSAETADAEHHA